MTRRELVARARLAIGAPPPNLADVFAQWEREAQRVEDRQRLREEALTPQILAAYERLSRK